MRSIPLPLVSAIILAVFSQAVFTQPVLAAVGDVYSCTGKKFSYVDDADGKPTGDGLQTRFEVTLDKLSIFVSPSIFIGKKTVTLPAKYLMGGLYAQNNRATLRLHIPQDAQSAKLLASEDFFDHLTHLMLSFFHSFQWFLFKDRIMINQTFSFLNCSQLRNPKAISQYRTFTLNSLPCP